MQILLSYIASFIKSSLTYWQISIISHLKKMIMDSILETALFERISERRQMLDKAEKNIKLINKAILDAAFRQAAKEKNPTFATMLDSVFDMLISSQLEIYED